MDLRQSFTLAYDPFMVYVQDNRVTDHRLKMNFELTSFLDGNIETAVQVYSFLFLGICCPNCNSNKRILITLEF